VEVFYRYIEICQGIIGKDLLSFHNRKLPAFILPHGCGSSIAFNYRAQIHRPTPIIFSKEFTA
jgi:hypothetical protein